MQQYFRKSLLLFLCAVLNAACANNTEGDETVLLYDYSIKASFISKTGTDLLDSVVRSDCWVSHADSICNIRGFSKYRSQMFLPPSEDILITPHSDGAPRQLIARWEDFYVQSTVSGYRPELRPKEYDDIFDIEFISPKIFGDSSVHTVRWHVHVDGIHSSTTLCEVDGEIVPDSVLGDKTDHEVNVHFVVE